MEGVKLEAPGIHTAPKTGSSARIGASSDAFSRMLQGAREAAGADGAAPKDDAQIDRIDVQNELVGYLQDWQSAAEAIQDKVSALPREVRDLVELQRSVHTLQLQTHLAAKAGETVSSTLRRVQQMGAG